MAEAGKENERPNTPSRVETLSDHNQTPQRSPSSLASATAGLDSTLPANSHSHSNNNMGGGNPNNQKSVVDPQLTASTSSHSSPAQLVPDLRLNTSLGIPSDLYDPTGHYTHAYSEQHKQNQDHRPHRVRGPQNHEQEESPDLDSPAAARNVRRHPAAPQQYHGSGEASIRGMRSLRGGANHGLRSSTAQNMNFSPTTRRNHPVQVQGRIVKQNRNRNDIEDPDYEDENDDDDDESEVMGFGRRNMQRARGYQGEYEDARILHRGHGEHRGNPMDMDFDDDDNEDGGEEYSGGDELSMFVPDPAHDRLNRVGKSHGGLRPVGGPIQTRPSIPEPMNHPAVTRRDSGRAKLDISFGAPNEDLAPSRYSGAPMPWGVNQQPVLVDQENVSDASLKKRGITRPPKGEKVCKRSYGTNDPENIKIVNLKETYGMSFHEIVEILNSERVKLGRDPKLTVCSVNGRYNRTAPIVFANKGLQFVPLSERKKSGDGHGKRISKASWTAQADEALVDAVKQIETEKWHRVAEIINNELHDGRNVYSAESCAKRYTSI